MGVGNNPLIGQGSDPILTLEVSDDGGSTFRAMPLRHLGLTGKRQSRAVWYNLGMSRDRVYQFRLSDPVELWATDAVLNVLPAMH